MNEDEAKKLAEFRRTVDLSGFNNQPYVRRIEKPWGYELHFVPDGMSYMGKLMHINAGCRQSLQVHDDKIETYLLLNGSGGVIIENTSGELEEILFDGNVGYTTKLGQKHRLFASSEEDVDIIEFSVPERGTTYHLADDYNRPSETEELRQKRNIEGRN